MPHCLRSGSRRKRLQVQHIHQSSRMLRGKINDGAVTKIDSFDQKEFLSLFGLHPINDRNGIRERKKIANFLEPIPTRRISKPRKVKSDRAEILKQSNELLKMKFEFEQEKQRSLQDKNVFLFNRMRDTLNDNRISETNYDNVKHTNIILKIAMKEFLKNMKYLCEPEPNFATLQIGQ